MSPTSKKKSRSCAICLEDFASEKEDDLEMNNPKVDLETCPHSFCQACLETHVQVAIENKKLPILCPEILCNVALEESFIESLLGKNADQGELCSRWKRLTSILANPSLVECPSCDTLVDSNDTSTHAHSAAHPGDSRNERNDLQCPHCHHEFCRLHGNSHPGLTCAAFRTSDAGRRLLRSEQILDRVTKPCSHCGARLHKQQGCDYVICANCKQDMCYKCGSHEHLTEGRFRHCAQCGSLFDGRLDFTWWMICLMVLAFALVLVLYPPIALIVVLITGCCCCGFRFGKSLDSRDPTYAPGRGFVGSVLVIFVPWILALGGENFAQRYLPDKWFTTTYVRSGSIPLQQVMTSESTESGPDSRRTKSSKHAGSEVDTDKA